MTTPDDFWFAHDALMLAMSQSEKSTRATTFANIRELKKAGVTAPQIAYLRTKHNRLRARAADPGKCVDIMVSYAVENNDRIAWGVIFARVDDFVTAGKVPPMAFLKAINDAFTNFRSTAGKSLDDAFFGKRGRGQPKASCVDYLWAKGNADPVAHFLARQGQSNSGLRGDFSPLDAAIRATIEFRKDGHGGKVPRGHSRSQILRQYTEFKK